ncbi:hypothetical protein TWF694_005365 [Orbilia ellipsospora]|uniref:Uncharacterized protein n=1 Tax=Orbilia ellipsospora TaxID=2528407 RepID=A0AAV9WTY9_9PEZI
MKRWASHTACVIVATFISITQARIQINPTSEQNETTLRVELPDIPQENLNPFERNQAIEFSWEDPLLQAHLGIKQSEHALSKRGGTFGPAIVIPSCLGCAGGAHGGGDTPCEIIANLWPSLAHVGNLERRAAHDRLQQADACNSNGAQYDIPRWYSWSYPPSGQLKSRPGAAFGYFDNNWQTQQGCNYWGLVETPSSQVLAGEEREYVSEHVLEVNSIALFFDAVAVELGKDSCKAIKQMMFAGSNTKEWQIYRVMGEFPHTAKVPGFPSIAKEYTGEMPILETTLNGVKMRIWQHITINDKVNFNDISLNGLDHMEALREIAMVWQYLNQKNVAEVLVDQWKRISDVFDDLEKTTRPLATTGITAAWTGWMKNQLNTMSQETEAFVQNAINVIASNEKKYATTEYISIIADQRKNGLLQQSNFKFGRIDDIKR